MKLSKAQQEVIDYAKNRIDYAREHSFCDWFRKGYGKSVASLNDAEVYEYINKKHSEGWHMSIESETENYEMNRNGIDYLCHASSATIRKLEKLGLIEIIEDSCGAKCYGFDTIKLLNY